MARPDTVWLVGHDAAGRRIDLPTTSLQFRPAPEYTTIEVLFLEAAFGVVTFTKLTVHLSENASLVLYWRGRRFSTIESRRCGQGDGARVLRRGIRVVRQGSRQSFDKSIAAESSSRAGGPSYGLGSSPGGRREEASAATTWMIEVYWNCSKVAEILAPHDAPMPLRLASSLASENE